MQFLVFSNRLLAMFLAAAIVYWPARNGDPRGRALKAPLLQVGDFWCFLVRVYMDGACGLRPTDVSRHDDPARTYVPTPPQTNPK